MSDAHVRWYYFCPCGTQVGWRSDKDANPKVQIVRVKSPHDTSFTEILRPRPFACEACGLDYDGCGEWKHEDEVPGVDYHPVFMGSFKPEITPHYNQSMGCFVESRKHLEHLQQKLGCEDVVVKAGAKCDNGVPDSVPRNVLSLASEAEKRVEEAAELMRKFPPPEDAFEPVTYDADEEAV